MGLISRVSSRTYRNVLHIIAMVLYTGMTVGWLLLLHACYSAAIYKSEHGLPADIVIQTLVGALMCAVTTVWHYGRFESIVSSNDSETSTSDFLMAYKSTPGFMNLRHRGYFRLHKNEDAFKTESPVHRNQRASETENDDENDLPEHDPNGPQIQEIQEE